MQRNVWIPDKDEEWIIAQVINEDEVNQTFSVETLEKKEQLIVPINQTCLFDSSHLEDIDDLCLLNNLHEGPLLSLLRRRWNRPIKDIYTYSGSVLISINPYMNIPGLYDNPLNYFDVPDDDAEDDPFEEEKTTLKPHLYYVANNALRNLFIQNDSNISNNQSIIISGESGAGMCSFY